MRAKAIYLTKAGARRVRWAPSNWLWRFGDKRRLPPRHLAHVGHGDFEQTGHQFLGYFTELGGLQAGDRVLDIGCGIGRMALPLTGYLGDGSYAGFDVNRRMVRWCQNNITPRWPSFEFTWVPVYNGTYNPFGSESGTDFRFPYEDSSFDFAFATSLFTHLLRREMHHYLTELARVLRPGGRCLMTFFLITPVAERELAAGRSMLPFDHPIAGGLTIDARQPEKAVAYPAADLRGHLAEVGLSARNPIHHGLWANTPGGLTLQDIVVAERVAV